MKKIKLLVFLLTAMFSIITIAGCNDTEKTVVITKELLEGLKFEDVTVDYDGEDHSIFVQDVPEGVTVNYIGNDKSFPGTYDVIAFLVYEDLNVERHAALTINRKNPVLTVEDNQVLFIYGNEMNPIYELDNESQAVEFKYYKDDVEVSHNALTTPGTYQVEVIALKSAVYEQVSQKVTVTTTNSKLGLSFKDKTVEYDGNEHEITLTGEGVEQYSVTYSGNFGTETGTYKALAEVRDSKGNLLETHAAVLKIVNPENEEFNEFLDKFFVEYLKEDQLSVNIFCENPKNFGLSHYDAVWYTYDNTEDEAEKAEYLEYINGLLAELEAFQNARLTKLQEIAYRNVEEILTELLASYEVENIEFMQLHYVDQFGGYVADFSTYMEAYTLYSEQEVQDIIDFINSTKNAFPSYLDYVSDRANAGFPLSDYTITKMCEYLEDVYKQKDNYYLIDFIGNKIDAVDFLGEDKKAQYKVDLENAFKDSFMEGVSELKDGLEDYKGLLAAEDEGYLSVYEGGKEYYLEELKALLGLENLDPEAYIQEVEKALSSAISDVIKTQTTIVRANNITTYGQLEEYMKNYLIYDGTPEEMMEYLKEFAKTLVPELKSQPEIYIKNMDMATAKSSSAAAYYMKSALDNTGTEDITLNPTKLGDKNNLISTLAHEGYPGHLYAYVNSKEIGLHNLNIIMTSTAHAEGWATYVSTQLYDYAIAHSSDPKFIEVMEYLKAQELSGHLFETRIDYGIHYEGWKVQEVYNIMSEYGYVYGDAAHYEEDMQSAKEVYYQMIEMPTTFAAYGYGKLTFLKLHNEAKEILGCYYNEVEFNTMIHSCGWVNLGELQTIYEEYMEGTCHKYGIEYQA